MVRQFSYQVPAGDPKKELLDQLDKVPTYGKFKNLKFYRLIVMLLTIYLKSYVFCLPSANTSIPGERTHRGKISNIYQSRPCYSRNEKTDEHNIKGCINMLRLC